MSNKKKSKRVSNKRPSLKGKWNKVGAPPKKTRWPGRPFTMDRLFELNAKGANKQCELSLRNKVSDGLINPPAPKPANPHGFLYMLADKKQKGGSVGRPKSQFVLKVKFDASRMTLRPSTEVAVTPTVAPVTPPRPVLPPNFRPPPVLNTAG